MCPQSGRPWCRMTGCARAHEATERRDRIFMKGRMVRTLLALALAATIGATLTMGADAAMNARKRAYRKDLMPAGWKYEAGYTVWRAKRGVAATPQTWRKYVREKERLARRGKSRGIDGKVLDVLDWTVEEMATFLDGSSQD